MVGIEQCSRWDEWNFVGINRKEGEVRGIIPLKFPDLSSRLGFEPIYYRSLVIYQSYILKKYIYNNVRILRIQPNTRDAKNSEFSRIKRLFLLTIQLLWDRKCLDSSQSVHVLIAPEKLILSRKKSTLKRRGRWPRWLVIRRFPPIKRS